MATLNPADLTVDESLPTYSSPLSLTSKPPISDQDAAAGRPLRLAARKKVVDALARVLNEEKRIKADIKAKWSSYTDVQKQSAQSQIDFLNRNQEYLAHVKFLKTEVVWWDNNLELSPREIQTRDTNFDEKNTSLKAKVQGQTNSLASSRSEMTSRLEREKREAEQAALKRTVYDDLSDSMSIMGKVLFWLVYILVGLRCASFAANEIMYKPLPYRVLVFFYTFLFTPIFGPYYLWIMIKRLIWKTPSPMYEGFFPMYPYDPSEPLTLNRRLFGYAESPQLRQWMDDERQKETAARDAAVVSKNIKQEIITERSK